MWRMLFLLVGMLLIVGCGGGTKTGSIAKTYPVTGKVVDAKGKPLTGGTVQFETGQAGDMTITGNIGSDGSYTVKTFRDKDQADGAPEGEYQVTVMPPLGSDNAAPAPVTLSKKFKVEAKDNTFDIDLSKMK